MRANRWERMSLGVMALIMCCVAGAAGVDYAKAVAEAQKEGDLGVVNRLCNEWIEAKPRDDRPRVILGRIYVSLGKVDLAVEQFELATEANPLITEPHCEMGDILLKAGKLSEAVKTYDEALRISRKCMPALLGKGRAMLAQGDEKGALAEARRGQQHKPDDARLSALCGEALLALGKPGEALVEAGKTVKQDPENADAWYCYAKTLDTLGRTEEAQEAWRRFLGLEQDEERATRARNGWVVLGIDALFPKLEGRTTSCALSPDGKQVAFVSYQDGIYRAPLDGQHAPVLIASCPEGCDQRHLSWSPDGTELLYYEAIYKTRGARVKRIQARLGQEPTQVNVPDVRRGLCRVVWSPSGQEFQVGVQNSGRRYSIDAVTGESRKFWFKDEAGKGLICGDADYMPNGRELVGAMALPYKGSFLHRAVLETGEAGPRIFSSPPMHPGSVVVSADGIAVAITLYGKTPDIRRHLTLVSTVPPYSTISLAEYRDPYARPDWYPEGRKLVGRIGGSGQDRLSVVRFGGLDRRPIGIAIKRTDDGALSAAVANRTENLQTVSLRWEAFDADSLRVGEAVERKELTTLTARATLEWELELPPEQKKSAQTVKVTALNQDGIGAVELMDWAEEGE